MTAGTSAGEALEPERRFEFAHYDEARQLVQGSESWPAQAVEVVKCQM